MEQMKENVDLNLNLGKCGNISSRPLLMYIFVDFCSGVDLMKQVLDGTQISMEEYEFLKDLIIPLGRAPHFAAQSGA